MICISPWTTRLEGSCSRKKVVLSCLDYEIGDVDTCMRQGIRSDGHLVQQSWQDKVRVLEMCARIALLLINIVTTGNDENAFEGSISHFT